MASQQPWPISCLISAALHRMRTELLCTQPYPFIKVFVVCPSDAGMIEGELHRLHRKGPMATKLTRPQAPRLPCVGCNTSSISQTSVKAKDHPRAKKCTAADLRWLATDNDQESYERLSQTSERVRFSRWWTFWAHDVDSVVALNMA